MKQNGFNQYIRNITLLCIGVFTGAFMFKYYNNNLGYATSLMKLQDIFNYIENVYVDTVDTQQLLETTITNVLDELDPHTSYLSTHEAEESREMMSGAFEGIGIEFSIVKDTITVVTPLAGGPSEKLGIQDGDKIVEINAENVAGIKITNNDVIKRLRGEKGTEVKVGIKRKNNSNLLIFNIIRDKIPQHSVEVAYMIDKEIGYIKVSRFTATTYREFYQSLKELLNKDMKKLVLDLQSNPGGYLDQAVRVTEEFLPPSKLIVFQKGKNPSVNNQFTSLRRGLFSEYPLIILINEGSASGSEIVAGALQDNDRALVVGRRSFGKGLVQAPFMLKDSSELRLTIARYYTPTGRLIQKPYSKGHKEEYLEDHWNRYEKGEFFHADSIEFSDSLKYKTLFKNRTVYGGGGIMPDYFVELDTIGNSEYLAKLLYSRSIMDYAIQYRDKHKKISKGIEVEEFVKTFQVTDVMLNELIGIGKELEVEFDEKGFKKSKSKMKLWVKAQIARLYYGNEGFYRVINKENEILMHSLQLFDDAKELMVRE